MQFHNLHRSFTLEWSIGLIELPCSHFTLHDAGRAHPLAVIEALPFLCWRSYLSMCQYSHEALLYQFRCRACFQSCCRLEQRRYSIVVVVSHRFLPSWGSSYSNYLHWECYYHLFAPIWTLTDPEYLIFNLRWWRTHHYHSKSNLAANQGSTGATGSWATAVWCAGTSALGSFLQACNWAESNLACWARSHHLTAHDDRTAHYHSWLNCWKYPWAVKRYYCQCCRRFGRWSRRGWTRCETRSLHDFATSAFLCTNWTSLSSCLPCSMACFSEHLH